MSSINEYLVDNNGDGFIDDSTARILANPASEQNASEFWARLIDAAARIGLKAQALPLPLFLATPTNAEAAIVHIRNLSDVAELSPMDKAPSSSAEDATVNQERSGDLLDLFSPSGLLRDRDGDLLPDATSFGLVLPDQFPDALGAALCNLAVRVGLESGGVTLPLVSDIRPALRVVLSEGPATMQLAEDGWLIEGDPDSLAALINAISQDWPAFESPETAGARDGIERLATLLVASEDQAERQLPIKWELQWSAQPEVDRLAEAIARRLIPRLTADSQIDLTIFACEPTATRRRFEAHVRSRIEALGVSIPRIKILSAFKTGLSWLTEVVLPELTGTDVTRLEIHYRRFEAPDERQHLDMPIRWLQELFPGDEIAAATLGIPLDAIVLSEDPSPDAPAYRATALDVEGRPLGSWELETISYSMPFMPNVTDSEYVTVTTGGFVATVDSERVIERVDTDLDRFWTFWQREVLARLIADIEAGGGFRTEQQPFFGTLEVEVWLSAPNNRLGVREENDSAAEALHEDIYFNTLDTIEVLGINTTGERTSAPGAVIPIVHLQDGVAPHAIVRLREAPEARRIAPKLRVEELSFSDGELVVGLDSGSADPSPGLTKSIGDHLNAVGGSEASFAAMLRVGHEQLALRLPLPEMLTSDTGEESPPMDRNIHGAAVATWSARAAQDDAASAWIEGHSYQGRQIPALALRSPSPDRVWSPVKLAILKPTVLIVARHHANEISSTNAALRLAFLVGTDPEWAALIKRLNIVLIPYENADGAALHARLAGVSGAATWKHHPARYNALGHEFGEDYFKPDSPFGEARVRPAIWHRWLPDVLVDNHGVPSHEWIQPFAAFGSPPRFRVSYWIPQALIYGIIRHVDDPDFPEHAEAAMALRDSVSQAFRDTEIGELNREIGASYRRWGQDRVPERFPGVFHDDMLWHIAGAPVDPEGRGFNVRYPRTTVLSWVTEVNDETATGAHLEMVANAHLIANRAMLDTVLAMDADVAESTIDLSDGRTIHQYKRKRPLGLR